MEKEEKLFDINKFIANAGDRVADRFKEEQQRIDFGGQPSIFIPVIYKLEFYLKVPLDESRVNGINKEEVNRRCGNYVDTVTPHPPPAAAVTPDQKPTNCFLQ